MVDITMSAEEAIADIFALDDAPITCSEVPTFIEKLAKRGYRLAPINFTGKLPCDVMVAPHTVIRRGCEVETLMLAISKRYGLPPEQTQITFG